MLDILNEFMWEKKGILVERRGILQMKQIELEMVMHTCKRSPQESEVIRKFREPGLQVPVLSVWAEGG